jgi:hypothetical protein
MAEERGVGEDGQGHRLAGVGGDAQFVRESYGDRGDERPDAVEEDWVLDLSFTNIYNGDISILCCSLRS